jgi:division protein CdvB (Snf7/Vps24/ESCRT-III family)
MNFFAIMQLLPKLGAILALLRSLPTVINETQVALRAVEAALKAVQDSGQSPVDVAGAISALQRGVGLLEQAENMIADVVGSQPAGVDIQSVQ